MVEQWMSLPGDATMSLGFSVTGDGQWILYSQFDVNGSDLILVDDFY
jgi:hypothetical protein